MVVRNPIEAHSSAARNINGGDSARKPCCSQCGCRYARPDSERGTPCLSVETLATRVRVLDPGPPMLLSRTSKFNTIASQVDELSKSILNAP